MKTSQQILKEAGIIPKLRLGAKTNKGVKSNGAYHVKLVADKEVTGRDQNTGKEISMVRYLLDVLMPDGKTWEKRTYTTKKYNKDTGEVSYLVQRFAEITEGSEVILEMKKMGIKNFVDVKEVNPSHEDDTVVVNEE